MVCLAAATYAHGVHMSSRHDCDFDIFFLFILFRYAFGSSEGLYLQFNIDVGQVCLGSPCLRPGTPVRHTFAGLVPFLSLRPVS